MVSKNSLPIKLQVIEEQELFHASYRAIFPEDGQINVAGISTNGDFTKLRAQLIDSRPQVLLMSTIKLDHDLVSEIVQIREEFPDIGLALIFLLYSNESLRQLKPLVARSSGGMAIFSKESLGKVEELTHILNSVAVGQIIIDPALTAGMFSEKSEDPIFKEITSREMEILGLISRGYTNTAIAETLFIDIRTVENHVNNLYGKLKNEPRFKNRHPRVSAAKLYLETTGDLVNAVC